MLDERPQNGAPRTCLAVVLAAGEGTRMRSARPKVLHEVAGRSLLAHALAAIAAADIGQVALVVGPGREDVVAQAAGARAFIQAERRGTAHAVLAARAAIAEGWDDLVVAFADTPLVRPETFALLRGRLAETGAAVVVLGFEARDPKGYGRLLTAGETLFAIREDRDATPEERAVTLCNAGLMALDGRLAIELLDSIGNDNAQNEFYLTDVVEMARRRGLGAAFATVDEAEVQGVNDRVQLARCEASMQARLRETAMRDGATLVDPASVTFSFDTRLGRDVLVEPHVVFAPGVRVADGARIRAFSHLEGADVGPRAIVGPFARLRPGAELAEDVHVGNFVEVKASRLAAGVKANHLSYIGDADIGARSNIGAGTITCNYNGFQKFRTTIGADVFVGSDSALVAPVKLGDGAYIGSGSVVTDDVGADSLALARARQIEKPGWARGFRETQAALKAAEGRAAKKG